MIDKTEEQIRKRWQGDIANPKVTVCTITFNHKDFIEQALDSFLRQETTFPFEIIVHDDLSTDGTKEIIEQYEKKYPIIISLTKGNVLSFSNRKNKNRTYRPNSFRVLILFLIDRLDNIRIFFFILFYYLFCSIS